MIPSGSDYLTPTSANLGVNVAQRLPEFPEELAALIVQQFAYVGVVEVSGVSVQEAALRGTMSVQMGKHGGENN